MSDKPKNVPVQIPHRGSVPHGLRFRVPWRIHEKAWQRYGKSYNQSAENIAQRGGFGLEELIYLLAGEDPFAVSGDDPMATDFFNRWPEERASHPEKQP